MTDKKFTKYFNAHYNRHTRLKEAIFNVHTNVHRFGWTSECLSFEMNQIRETEDWQRLPESWRATLNGFADGIRKWFDREYIRHAYLCRDGLFRIDRTYDMPSANTLKSLVPDTCLLVWKHKPDRVYGGLDDKTKNVIVSSLISKITCGSVFGERDSYISLTPHHKNSSIMSSVAIPIPVPPHNTK